MIYTYLKRIPPIRFSQISIHACLLSHQALASFKYDIYIYENKLGYKHV